MGSLLLAVCCAAVRIRCLERATMRFVCLSLLLIALVALARAEVEEVEGTCGGNCPSNTCSSCDCGTSPNNVNINSYCSKYSDWSQSCCQCIVQHESGGNANAQNHNTNGSDDVGLFQINDFNWASCSGGSAPCNPDTNTKCAHDVWSWGGKTWKNWATCGACGCCNKA